MKPHDFTYQLRLTVPTLVVLVVAACLRAHLGTSNPSNKLESCLEMMGRTGLSIIDEGELTAGYYEGLLDGTKETALHGRGFLSNASGLKPPPADWKDFNDTEAVLKVDGYIKFEIKPNVRIELCGDRLDSNRWGQRDKDYAQSKPQGVRRLALVGSSIGMGTGVPMEQTYQALLEDSLNATPPCPEAEHYEILNFSVPGYRITQLMETAITKAPMFQVDVVLFEVNYLAIAPNWSGHISALVRDGTDLKYDFLRQFAAKANLKPSDNASKTATKLALYRSDIVRECIRETKDQLARHGIQLVVLAIPMTGAREEVHEKVWEVIDGLKSLNLPVASAMDAFGNLPIDQLRIREWDNHPNILGHKLMFEALDKEIRTKPQLRTIVAGCKE